MNGLVLRAGLAHAFVTLVLWPWPVFQILHVESAAVVAFAAFFIAGLTEIGRLKTLSRLWSAGRRQVGLLSIPLLMLSVSMFWAPNCAYWTGLVYFILFTVPSVLLALAVAYCIRGGGIRRPKLLLVMVGLGVAVAGVVYDLALHPQFFTFNHVFGGIMGPIYDEEFGWRWGLVWFRLLTVAWVGLIVMLGTFLRMLRLPDTSMYPAGRARMSAVASVLAVIIGILYINSAQLGFNTPEWYIQESLGRSTESGNFVFHFDDRDLTSDELSRIAWPLEYHHQLLQKRLGSPGPSPIHVYLYPDPFTRERLTGARFTNVAPVWLRKPQIHVLSSESHRTMTHELVHVFSRDFGLPWINASPSVGLVEGLAVALEAPHGAPSPHDQVSAALFRRESQDRGVRAEDLAARMSPFGFWSGRGAVSYTTTGSFVGYLLAMYPADLFKETYRSGSFAPYDRSLESLVEEWLQWIASRRYVSAAAGPVSSERFGVPSLFEKRCPHYAPPHRQEYLDALRSQFASDTTAAFAHARASIEHADYAPAFRLLASLHAARGEYSDILRLDAAARAMELGPAFALQVADAHAISGSATEAEERYDDLLNKVPTTSREFRATVFARRAALKNGTIRLMLGRDTPAETETDEDPSLAAALYYLQQGSAVEAIDVLSCPSGDEHSFSEEIRLMNRLCLRIAASAHWQARRFEEAAELSQELFARDMKDGDVDGAVLAGYRAAMFRWMLERVEEET